MSKRKQFEKGVPGCFSPPLTDELLLEYRSLIATAAEPVRGAARQLLAMADAFLETPRSTERPEILPMVAMKDGQVITKAECRPLEDAEVERMWDLVPWKDEAARNRHGAFDDDHCDQYGELFEGLPAGDLRNAAFHLLWYARELARDREPMTNDLL